MDSEQRVSEIAEIKKLLDEVEAMAHYQIFKLERIRTLVAEIEGRSEQVKTIEAEARAFRAAGSL